MDFTIPSYNYTNQIPNITQFQFEYGMIKFAGQQKRIHICSV